jgi:hypothetical protein
MSTRSSILAFTAIAALGGAALAPTSASALGGSGFGVHNVHPVHPVHPIGVHPVKPIHPIHPIWPTKPIVWPWPHPHRHHWWFARYRPYYVTPAVTTTAVSTPVVRNTCNCLTKEYLPDGSVLFKDLCTKEAAMASPETQAQGPVPQTR